MNVNGSKNGGGLGTEAMVSQVSQVAGCIVGWSFFLNRNNYNMKLFSFYIQINVFTQIIFCTIVKIQYTVK